MQASIIIELKLFRDGGKGGAIGPKPHLILRVLQRILIFDHRNIFYSVS